MRSDQSTQPIGAVETYFGAGMIPTIAQQFTPGRGWQTHSEREPVSRTAVRALAARGSTALALFHDGRLADFRVSELLQADKRHTRRQAR